jgi:hypothetical protein
MLRVQEVPALVKNLLETVKKLEELFPGRRFTLDGHLVGSLGEVLAAHRYNLELLRGSTEGHDAKAPDGRMVQIKATQRGMVGLRSKPDHLVVLQLSADGVSTEVFNGPGSLAWDAAGKPQKNGQRQVSLSRLRGLMQDVQPKDALNAVAT